MSEGAEPSDMEITKLLIDWKEGDDRAMEEMIPLVYEKLRSIANFYLRKGGNQTLSSTALVHEAYLRVFGQRQVEWQDRNHFFAISAKIMRRLIIEYQTSRRRQKRGGGQVMLTLDNADRLGDNTDQDLAELGHCMEELEAFDKRKAWIIDMHYFVGLQIEEIAEVLSVSRSTVQRELSFAKAWLHRCLNRN